MHQVAAAAETLRSARLSMQATQKKFTEDNADSTVVPQMTRRGSLPRSGLANAAPEDSPENLSRAAVSRSVRPQKASQAPKSQVIHFSMAP